jgi:hypothetical protein
LNLLKGLLLLFLIALGSFFYWLNDKRVNNKADTFLTGEPDTAAGRESGAESVAVVKSAVKKLSPGKQTLSDSPPSILASAPSQLLLKAQKLQFPHSTPPALLGFSVAIAERTDAAQNKPEVAQKTFQQLADCARQAEVAQVQALCLSNAHRLSENQPSLQAAFKSLVQGASPSVRELFQRLQ